jgi:hypothetical protein
MMGMRCVNFPGGNAYVGLEGSCVRLVLNGWHHGTPSSACEIARASTGVSSAARVHDVEVL